MSTEAATPTAAAGSAPALELDPATPTEFDPARPWRLSSGVALRDESFGALAYDFTTRRLSFLKSRLLVDVVRGLDNAPDVGSALTAAGVPEGDRAQYLRALKGLALSGMLTAEGVPR